MNLPASTLHCELNRRQIEHFLTRQTEGAAAAQGGAAASASALKLAPFLHREAEGGHAMYRAAFVTPEMLLVEYSIYCAPPMRRVPEALSFMLHLASALCGLR
jgi:hypothetical protein